jgi:hypothetical protein
MDRVTDLDIEVRSAIRVENFVIWLDIAVDGALTVAFHTDSVEYISIYVAVLGELRIPSSWAAGTRTPVAC